MAIKVYSVCAGKWSIHLQTWRHKNKTCLIWDPRDPITEHQMMSKGCIITQTKSKVFSFHKTILSFDWIPGASPQVQPHVDLWDSEKGATFVFLRKLHLGVGSKKNKSTSNWERKHGLQRHTSTCFVSFILVASPGSFEKHDGSSKSSTIELRKFGMDWMKLIKLLIRIPKPLPLF